MCIWSLAEKLLWSWAFSRQPPQLLVSVMFALNCVDFLPCRGVCYSSQENSCCNCKGSSHAVGLSNDRLKPTQPHWLPCHERAAARISKCNLRVRVCMRWYAHIINWFMSLYRASTAEHRGGGVICLRENELGHTRGVFALELAMYPGGYNLPFRQEMWM